MRAGDPGEPAVVPLGPAADLDAEIARWRNQMTPWRWAGGRSTARAEAAVRRSGSSAARKDLGLRSLPQLAGASRIFIVPDGPLHLVNWEALPIDGPHI